MINTRHTRHKTTATLINYNKIIRNNKVTPNLQGKGKGGAKLKMKND